MLCAATAFFAATFISQANAATFSFNFFGGGTSGSVTLTYGSATDTKTPSGFEVTGIAGTFTDTNIGINNAQITGLVPINHAAPEATNLLAPNDFSKFLVASGNSEGSMSFDNLFYPTGSPQTASDYPFHGGFVDIYGLLFTIGNGDVVNFWSNGVTPGTTAPDYGVGVATAAQQLDYVGGGVVATPTPEPGSLYLLATGVAGVLARRRWKA